MDTASFLLVIVFLSIVTVMIVITVAVTICMSHRLNSRTGKLKHRVIERDIIKQKHRGVDEVDPCLKTVESNYV